MSEKSDMCVSFSAVRDRYQQFLKITNHINETLFYFIIENLHPATMMLLNKSKQCFDFAIAIDLSLRKGGRKAKYP